MIFAGMHGELGMHGESGSQRMAKPLRIATLMLFIALFALQPGCERRGTPPNSVAPTPSPTPSQTGNNVVTVDIDLSTDSASRILLEAEAGRIKEPMKVFADKAASGGKYVLAPEGPDHKEINKGGDVAITFKVEEAGKYEMWLRVWWHCGCANSFGVSLDGKAHDDIGNNNYGAWQWMRIKAGPLGLSAGDHLLVVTNREDGARLDQVLLIQDSEYVPTGIEKPSP